MTGSRGLRVSELIDWQSATSLCQLYDFDISLWPNSNQPGVQWNDQWITLPAGAGVHRGHATAARQHRAAAAARVCQPGHRGG